MEKIGVFGGSFNPMHNGHINLIIGCKETLELDRVIVVPSGVPVHKDGSQIINGEDRLRMCKLAVEKHPWCEVSDMELTRKEKSFTVITLRELKRKYPNDTLFLLIGSDMFTTFHLWHLYKEILSLVVICVMKRDDVSDEKMEKTKRELESEGGEIEIIHCPIVEISSSMIRDMIKKSENVSELMPQEVLMYITEKGLYK